MRRAATLFGATAAGLFLGDMDAVLSRPGDFAVAALFSPVFVFVGGHLTGLLFWPVWSWLAWRWWKHQQLATALIIVAWSTPGFFRLLDRFDIAMSA